jgi:hypothetical protein
MLNEYKDPEVGEKSLLQLLNIIEKKKDFSISRGNNAIVLIPKSKNYVYKLWTIDSGWEEWLAICRKNQHLQSIPKIYGKTKQIKNNFVIAGDDISMTINVVKIENLSPMNSEDEQDYDDIIDSDSFMRIKPAKIENEFLSEYVKEIQQVIKQNKISSDFDFTTDNTLMRGEVFVAHDILYPRNSDSDTMVKNIMYLLDDAYGRGISYKQKGKEIIPSNDILIHNMNAWVDDELCKRFTASDLQSLQKYQISTIITDKIAKGRGNPLSAMFVDYLLSNTINELHCMYVDYLCEYKIYDEEFIKYILKNFMSIMVYSRNRISNSLAKCSIYSGLIKQASPVVQNEIKIKRK